MTVDVSSFNSKINLIASSTFPAGFIITQGADDADFYDVPSVQIGDSAMGINGDLIKWSKANPLKVTLNVIPFSDDDINLGILLEANRVGKGKQSARDIITLSILYPNDDFVTFLNGIITDGMPANAASSSGRLKTKSYAFAFENKVGI